MSRETDKLKKYMGLDKPDQSTRGTLHMYATRVFAASVHSGTLWVKVYDEAGEGLLGGVRQGPEGREDGEWIPMLLPLSTNLELYGPIMNGDAVLIIYPEGNPLKGIAIRTQMPGEVQDSEPIKLDVAGPATVLANWS